MTRTNDTARERQLERYLLGTLAADEQDRLEEAFLADHDLFGELDAAEGVLIDRYLEGDLPSEERQIFEERLLPSQRVRDRVAMAGALQRLADERARCTDGEAGAEVVPISPFQPRGTVPPRRTTNWLAWAACLVLMLATGYLAVLNVRLQGRFEDVRAKGQEAVDRMTAAEQVATEQAEELSAATSRAQSSTRRISSLEEELAERKDRIADLENELGKSERSTPEPSALTAKPSIVLLALTTRGDDQPIIELPKDRPLEFQLDLDRLHPDHPLTVIVRRDGNLIWEQNDLEVTAVGQETMVSVTLPAASLFAGSYLFEVIINDDNEEYTVGSYSLVARN